MSRFIYLHGMASSPRSKKALAFGKFFANQGWSLEIPELEEEGFENLTLSGQMKVVQSIFENHPGETFGLIGSSLGGYLAALTGEYRKEVAAVYLMAPAFGFLPRWRVKISEIYGKGQIPEWIEVFHFRYNESKRLSTRIFQDAEKWEAIAFKRKYPSRIVHGIYDDSVPIEESRRFSNSRAYVDLIELNSDHGLLSHLDWIITDCVDFFRKKELL
tara:strand:+ start:287 stop:934 length:648 start_codon:yes stop_codon:yes gene_type:complete